MEKIKLVVGDDDLLGYIDPETPTLVNTIRIWRTSFFYSPGSGTTGFGKSFFKNQFESIRLASQTDFERFKVCSKGFTDNPEVYEFA